jgi:hypothetical protein
VYASHPCFYKNKNYFKILVILSFLSYGLYENLSSPPSFNKTQNTKQNKIFLDIFIFQTKLVLFYFEFTKVCKTVLK